MKKYLRDYAFLALVAGLIIAADQITKAAVRNNLGFGEMWAPWDWMLPYARIVYWYNTGVAFGMFQGKGLIFTILSFLVSLAIIYYYPRIPAGEKWMRLALGLQLGGAVGNLIDRVLWGHVIDFISVGTFPVLNIADASITTGVALLILTVWLEDRRERANAQAAETQPAPALPNDEISSEQEHLS